MGTSSLSGTRAAIRVPTGQERADDAAPLALDNDGPTLEVADNELMDDIGDDDPHSVTRPSLPGILPARAKTALGTAAESERFLRDLLRTTQFLSAAVQGACERTTDNVRELESLDGALQYQADDYRRLYQRVQELELELRDARDSAEREWRRLATEQDAFIAELITDHERVAHALRARLEEQQRQNEQLTERLAKGDAPSSDKSEPT